MKGAGEGRVLAVCLGPGGIPKHPVPRAAVGPLGLEGDGHRFHLHGGPDRAVCLLFETEVASLAADGVSPTTPGTFGENLRLEGIDPARLRPGDRLHIGPEVLLELVDVREPCATLRSVDRRFPDLFVGRSGFLARVIRSGELAPGMAVRVVPAGPGTGGG